MRRYIDDNTIMVGDFNTSLIIGQINLTVNKEIRVLNYCTYMCQKLNKQLSSMNMEHSPNISRVAHYEYP